MGKKDVFDQNNFLEGLSQLIQQTVSGLGYLLKSKNEIASWRVSLTSLKERHLEVL